MADRETKKDEAPEPDPAAQPRTVSVAGAPAGGPPADAPVAVRPAVAALHTTAEIGPGPAFDPAPRFKVAPVVGPDGKGAKKLVIYRGPSDNFQVADGEGNSYLLDRLEPVELPKSVLDWLRANQPGHSFEEVPA